MNMRSKVLILIAMCFLTFSCNKDSLDSGGIEGVTSSLEGPANLTAKRRLAFGKSLAYALRHKSLREYILRHSTAPGETHFKEIIFNLHKDSIVSGDLTLSQLIKASADNEINSLFGDNLIEEVFQNDPCVVIKIPDIFLGLAWDTDDIIPMVYVNTSHFIHKSGIYCGSRMGYHYSGYSTPIETYVHEYKNVKHFFLTIKYSEDYFLLNSDYQNEAGKPLSMLLPQISQCEQSIGDIMQSGIEASNPGWKYVPKQEAFRIWRTNCGYTGPYLYDDPACGSDKCHRDCAPDGGKYIVEKVGMQEPLYVNIWSIYDEALNLGFHFYNKGPIPFEEVACVIPGWRKSSMNCSEIEMKLHVRDYSFNGRKYEIPEIEVTEISSLCKAPNSVEVHFLAAGSYPKEMNLQESFYHYTQNDASREISVSPPSAFKLFATEITGGYHVNIPYCTNNAIGNSYGTYEVFYKY